MSTATPEPVFNAHKLAVRTGIALCNTLVQACSRQLLLTDRSPLNLWAIMHILDFASEQEGVERRVVLHRCAERREVYQSRYLFPQCGIDDEEVWLNSM